MKAEIKEEINGKIRECIKAVKGEYFIHEYNLLSEELLSSFDILDLVTRLEECFDMKFPRDIILPENFESINAIEKLLLMEIQKKEQK